MNTMNTMNKINKSNKLNELTELHIISHNQEEIQEAINRLNKIEMVSQFTTRLNFSIKHISEEKIYKIHSNDEYLFILKNNNGEHNYIYRYQNKFYIFQQNDYIKTSLYGLIVIADIYKENIDEFNKKLIEIYDETNGMFVSRTCLERYSKIRNNLEECFYKIEDDTKFVEYFENKFKQKLFQYKNQVSIMNFDEYTKIKYTKKENKNKQVTSKISNISNPENEKNIKNKENRMNEETLTDKQNTVTNNNITNEMLFTKEAISKLPVELQVSYQEAQDLYNKNKNFLDQNDKVLIKAFKRGKIWSAGYYGPSGTGKTTKLIAIAGALGLPYLKVTGSRNIDEAYLFGKYVLKNGSTVFEYGPLTKVMKYGGVFIFDEINMIDGDVLSSLNDLLDGSRMKVLDSGEVIKAHPNFRFAESMNIGYAGTNEMNISHKSRIQFKNKLSEISTETMAKIVVNETGIEEKTALEMSSLVSTFNDIIDNLGDATSQRIDIRHIINWANLTIDLDNDILSASILTVISSLTEEDDEVGNTTEEYLETSNGIGSEIYKVIKTTFQN